MRQIWSPPIAPDVHEGHPRCPTVLGHVVMAEHDKGVALLDELVRRQFERVPRADRLLQGEAMTERIRSH